MAANYRELQPIDGCPSKPCPEHRQVAPCRNGRRRWTMAMPPAPSADQRSKSRKPQRGTQASCRPPLCRRTGKPSPALAPAAGAKKRAPWLLVDQKAENHKGRTRPNDSLSIRVLDKPSRIPTWRYMVRHMKGNHASKTSRGKRIIRKYPFPPQQ